MPKYRGPSPIKTAILNGDKDMDVCLMQMTNELDAGDVYMRENIEIGENDTNETMENHVSQTAIKMLDKYLKNPSAFSPVPQGDGATYTRKFNGDDEIIDWKNTSKQIHNQIRALSCGRTKINGVDVKILETRVENDELKIVKIQPAGKKSMDWKSFVNGLRGNKIEYGE